MPITVSGTLITFNDITTMSSGQQAAKAWVNFNGTGSISANQTIRSNYNVSSVFKNGTGDYTVNFTNALADGNYASVISVGTSSSADLTIIGSTANVAPTASAFRFSVNNGGSGAARDATYASVSIFR
jgi:hypothetical protein